MQVGSRSDTGHVRKRNEDALLVEPDRGLFAVADGMGGHPAGDVASALAVDRLRESLGRDDGSDPGRRLAEALEEAHASVLADAEATPGRAGMGTTVVVALVQPEATWVAHVGDSRCYVLTSGQLRPVTADHGAGGYLTQAVGLDRGVRPDVVEVPLGEGDRLLLCTDGLTNMVDDAEIEAILREVEGAQAACDALASAALDAGGVDNITTVVVDR
jgi:PPM family protein phosphatase